MNNYQNLTLAVLLVPLLVIGLSAIPAQATERAPQETLAVSKAHALSPAQLTAIRSIGRNVLAAKKSGTEDGADVAQLISLRASLDQLIAADLDLGNRMPITVQGQENGEQSKMRKRIADLREAARADARAVAVQLRHRGELKAARAHATPAKDTRSAGLPIGVQRAYLFERWAQKLDAALAEDNADRLGQLRVLREQLRVTRGSLSDAPITHSTPTLQAMPAGFVPPKLPNQAPNQVSTQSDGAANP